MKSIDLCICSLSCLERSFEQNYFTLCQNRCQKAHKRRLYVCAGGLDILKSDKNSTYLQCFVIQFGRGGLELCFGGLSPPKPPVATGLLCISTPQFRLNGIFQMNMFKCNKFAIFTNLAFFFAYELFIVHIKSNQNYACINIRARLPEQHQE